MPSAQPAARISPSAACRNLIRMGLLEAILLNTDILWGAVLDQPEENYRTFLET